MLTSLPILLVWTGPEAYQFSPTQISTHDECQRKWAWKRIAKIDTPQAASAALGTRVHSVLERYLGKGEQPDFVTDRVAAEVAQSGLHLLPSPKTEGMWLEQNFHFKSARTGFIYHGFKDVQIRPGVPALGFDGSAPIVIDHKTTKSINKYAKSEDDLQYDAQSTLYGLDAMARYASDSVDLGWVYYQTEGAKRSHTSRTRLHAPHALKVFDEIEKVAEQAATALEKKRLPLELPPNPSACGAYGGCPYRHLCNDLTPSQSIRSRMSNSYIASLRARVQGAAPPVVQEKPEVMGCADTDVPAPTEIPAVFAGTQINPPEGSLPPPTVQAAPVEEKPAKRTRRTKEQIAADKAAKDPVGADAHAHTNEKLTTGAPPAPLEGAGDAGYTLSNEAAQAQVDKAVAHCDQPVPTRIVEMVQTDWTLYVDCIPTKGARAKQASGLIEKAQARMSTDGPQDKDGNRVCDYRLVEFGKGAPFLVQFVAEQVDGTFDIALDTRTPEGAVLLEPLSAMATRVFRGFR